MQFWCVAYDFQVRFRWSGAVLVQFWCSVDAVLVQFCCSFGAVLVQCWCSFCVVVVQFWCSLVHKYISTHVQIQKHYYSKSHNRQQILEIRQRECKSPSTSIKQGINDTSGLEQHIPKNTSQTNIQRHLHFQYNYSRTS